MLGPGPACALAAALANAPGPAVHIDVDPPRRGPVTLYAVQLDAIPGRFVQGVRRSRSVACESPCDRPVDTSTGAAFVVGGPRTTRSRAFTLPPDGTARLEVKPGRKGVFVAGWVLTGIGGAALLGGVGTMIFADNDRRLLTAGGITLASAIPFLIAGAAMVATSRTRVRVRSR